MFVKKLVEKASLKKPGGNPDGLKSDDVNPCLVFHYGVPSGCTMLAHDPIQKILAISTRDGRIKLFGQDNTQAVLESPEVVPSKFLQFIHNQGFLININEKNHIEVWDIESKLLSHVHLYQEEITSFTVIQRSLYMYVGDSFGNVSILKLDQEPCNIVQMKYRIPFSASRGNSTEDLSDAAAMYILPQPTAQSKRVLIVYRDGLVTLWDIQDSKVSFTTGGTMMQSLNHDKKKVTAACWACPFGSKVVLGYSNGEILIWSIPHTSNSKTELAMDKELCTNQGGPLFKLNLGYKLEKVPIARLKWADADGKASRLYVLGSSDFSSANLLQVIIINEQIESLTTKLGIPSPEPCLDMEIVSSSSEQSKHKDNCFLVLGKSGHVNVYDDFSIEKYLVQSQSRSQQSLPKEIKVKIPFFEPSICVAKFITDNPCMLSSADEDYISLSKKVPSLFAFDTKQKDASTHFSSFSNFKNVYITGHSNGVINFWDASCPLLVPFVSFNQQSEDDHSSSGVPLTAICFDSEARLLISGDQSGMVRIFKLKPEPYATESSFLSLQGSSKKGSNITQSLKQVKVSGAVLSISTSHSSKHIAVGSEQGYVSLIDIEGPILLYERHIASELSTAVVSLQFGMCSLHGFEKSVLAVATKDSSVLALESDTGNILSTGTVHPKKPSKALFIRMLDEQGTSGRGSNVSRGVDLKRGNSFDDGVVKDLLLLCSEKAAYVYSLPHVVQGVKKVCYKKKFHSSACCWASTFCSDTGLILVFSNGKVEIRSLPELSLLRETSIRGLALSTSKPNSLPNNSICASQNGDIIMVNSDQEIFIVSVLVQREIFRHMDSVTRVYNKQLIVPQGLHSDHIIHKEKRKGIFGSVIKGSKPKSEPLTEEGARESLEELSTLFLVANFPFESESRENFPTDEDEVELDIDDIDIDEPEEKPKGNTMMAALKKQKLSSKFQALKGKLNQMNVKKERVQVMEEQPQEKAGTVDQIKKKYGFTLTGETSAAKMATNKLNENIKKLKGINLKTAEMQDNAQTFSSMAKEVLRTTEHSRHSQGNS